MLSCGNKWESAEYRDRDSWFSGDISLNFSNINTASDTALLSCSFSGSVFESDIDSWCVDILLKEFGLEVVGRDELMFDLLMYSERVCLLGDPRAPVWVSRVAFSLPVGPSVLFPWRPITHAAGHNAADGKASGGGGEKDSGILGRFIHMSSREDPVTSGECTISSRRSSADIE